MKADLHVHTKYSGDCISPIEKIIKTARKKDIDAVAITDHDTVAGWKEARSLSKKLNFPIILGEEITTIEEGRASGHVLGLFLSEAIHSKKPIEVMEEIKSQGGIVVIPHPFDKDRMAFENIDRYVKLIDAVEAFNSKVGSNLLNLKAFEFAFKNNLRTTGGSDAHIWYNVGNAYTLADVPDVEELRKALKNGKTGAYGKLNPFYTKFFPTFARICKFAFR